MSWIVRGSASLVLFLACATSPPPAAPAVTTKTPPSIQQRYASIPAQPPVDPARRAKAAELEPKLDELFAGDVKENDLPGLGVAIVLDGQVVYMKGFGFRDLASKAPFDADTVFRIASVTKSFAAMAALKLRDEGKLSLDEPVAKYDPLLGRLAYPTRDSPPITLRQLLTHGSGLPEDNFYLDVSIDMSAAEFESFLQPGLSFSRAPNTHFEYSNIGFGMVGRVIERVAGMPARRYITQEILAPLGMTASGWEPEEIARDHLAVGYWGADGYLGRDKQKIAAPVEKDGAFDVAGGLYTTLRDFSRYMAFHLSAWPPRDDPETGPVRRATLREMQQGTRHGDFREFALLARDTPPYAQVEEDSISLKGMSYGNGFITATSCTDDFEVSHSGGLPGFNTQLLMLPDAGYAIVVFVNDVRMEARPADEATQLFREAGLLGRRSVTPVPALRAAKETVEKLLGSYSVEEARRIIEPTFFVYESPERMGDDFKKLAETHGRCEPGELTAVNLLRGKWKMKCEHGNIRFAAALSPKAEPKLQYLLWAEEMPPSGQLQKAASGLLKLSRSWDAGAAKALLADPAASRDKVSRFVLDAGSCKLGDWVDGDGKTVALYSLTCTKRPMRLAVTLDEKSGKVVSFRTGRPRSPTAMNCAL